VTEMDSALAEATKIRVQERDVYAKAVKDYSESQEACAAAMEVLRNYYEGAAAASFVQTGMHTQAKAKAKAKAMSHFWETEGTRSASSTSDGSGVIGMLEVAESDFATLLAEAKSEEQVAMDEFAKMQTDTKVLKATKQAEIKGKQTAIAGLKSSLMNFGDDKEGVSSELDAVLAYQEKLKPQCEVKVPSYEERKERREKELEGLKNALDILNGGIPVAFLQKRSQIQHHRQNTESPKMAPKAAVKTLKTMNEQGLKDAMRHMMDDDDEDDIEGSSSNTAFLQSEQGSDAYMEDSANSLSEALGPRWNAKELETTADQNTHALLQGIANPKALNGLNGMMNAMMSLR